MKERSLRRAAPGPVSAPVRAMYTKLRGDQPGGLLFGRYARVAVLNAVDGVRREIAQVPMGTFHSIDQLLFVRSAPMDSLSLGYRARLKRWAGQNSPGVEPLFDFGLRQDRWVLVSQYLHGASLNRLGPWLEGRLMLCLALLQLAAADLPLSAADDLPSRAQLRVGRGGRMFVCAPREGAPSEQRGDLSMRLLSIFVGLALGELRGATSMRGWDDLPVLIDEVLERSKLSAMDAAAARRFLHQPGDWGSDRSAALLESSLTLAGVRDFWAQVERCEQACWRAASSA